MIVFNLGTGEAYSKDGGSAPAGHRLNFLVTTVKLEGSLPMDRTQRTWGPQQALWDSLTPRMSLPLSSPCFPPVENPVIEVTSHQTAVLFNSQVMCVACLCLNGKLAFLLLVLLFLLIGQFPPLYLAGQIVKVQCNAEYAYSKGGNKNDDDGDDVFIQFCPSTKTENWEGSRARKITLPQPTKPSSRSHPPQPTEILLLPMFG